jgi:hypothetical protein
MLRFLNENAGALSVLFSLVVTGATVVYAWLTAQLVSETRRMRRAQSDPKIALGLAPHQFRFGFVDLLIVNEGSGSAHDVTFEVHPDETADPELVQKLQDYGLIKRGLKYMSPRQEVRTFFASMIERDERRMNTNIDVTVRYRTPSGEPGQGRYSLDFSPYWGHSELGKHPLVEMESILKKIEEHVGAVVCGWSKVPVRTFTLEEEVRQGKVTELYMKLNRLSAADWADVQSLVDERSTSARSSPAG